MFRKSFAVACAVAAALSSLGTGIALADVPLPTVGGKIFADLTNLDEKENGSRIAPGGSGIDVQRFYLIFNEKFDDMWSATIATDASYSSGGGAVDVYIKKAYLQCSLPGSKAFFARLGSADLPWVPLVEDLYGYRYVEHVEVDRLHFGTSADWGLHAGGQGGGARYAVSVVTGSGSTNPTRSKSMDAEARLAYG
ncbi:MAG: porin, partial [Steroidobacteraceae bacterium]